jgi:uncharacterized membrane protein YhdT
MGDVARGWTDELPSLRDRAAARTALLFVVLCLGLHLVFYLLWRALDDNLVTRAFVFDEDQLVETLSAIMFLGASLYAARRWWIDAGTSPLDRLALAGLAAIALVGFMDEISFGERVFRFDVYEIAGVRIDGAHDFIEVANTLRREWLGPIHFAEKIKLVALGFSLMIVAALAAWKIAAYVRQAAPKCLRLPALALACVFLAELGLSAAVDIRVFSFAGDQAMEEIAELNLAALLAGLAMIIGKATDAG